MTNVDKKSLNEIEAFEEATAGTLVENLGIGVTLIDPSMRIVSVNARMRFWYPDRDFTTHPYCYEVFNEPAQDYVCLYCPVVKTFQDGTTHEAITETPTNAGITHFRIISTPLRNSNGVVTNVVELVEDITDKVRLEKELWVRNQALESAHFGILITDLTGNILYINPAFEKLSRWGEKSEILGKPVTSLTKNPDEIREILRTVIEKGSFEGVFSSTHCDGSPFDLWYDSTLVYDDQRQPLCILGTMTDITTRRQTEESLYLYRNIMENSREAIFISDPEGKIVSANSAFHELLGITRKDSEEKNIWDFLPEQTQVLVSDVILPAVKIHDSWEGEFILCNSNGGLFPAWGRAGGIHDPPDQLVYIFVFMHDITEQANLTMALHRSQAELEQRVDERTKALQQSELILRALLNAIPASAFMVGLDGTTLIANVNTAQIMGLTVDGMVGRNFFDLLPPDLATSRKKHLERVLQNGKPDRFTDKHSGHWIDNTVYPIHDDKGEVISVAILGLDVTERVKAEQDLEEKADELMRSNAELEQFAYVASHDLQEPLRMVTSYLQLIAKTYDSLLDDDGREYIQFAVDGAKRMNTLIRDLLTFSRVGTRAKEFSQVNLSEVLDRVVHNMKIPIEDAQAKIEWDNLPVIWAESTQMEQLFQNLISNAIKFHSVNPPRIFISSQKEKNEWLFSVKDNGIGLDLRHAERIFVIFQRLHRRDEYPGTGIGLAICKKIVERHGGRIWVDSAPDKGSTFFFTIPYKEGD